jgi:hypothetical protein
MINGRFQIKPTEAEDSAYRKTIASAPDFHRPLNRYTVPFAATESNLYVANNTTLWKLPPMGSAGDPKPYDCAVWLEGAAIVDLCACEKYGHMFMTVQKMIGGMVLSWTRVIDLYTLEFPVQTLFPGKNVTTTALVNGNVCVCDANKVHVYEHSRTKRLDACNPTDTEKWNEEHTPWIKTHDIPMPWHDAVALCSVTVGEETRIFVTERKGVAPGRILVMDTNGTLRNSFVVLDTNERFVGRMLVRTIDRASYLYTTVNTGTGVALSVRIFQITDLWK